MSGATKRKPSAIDAPTQSALDRVLAAMKERTAEQEARVVQAAAVIEAYGAQEGKRFGPSRFAKSGAGAKKEWSPYKDD